MEVEYALAQQLQGHESQVRCVAILRDGTLVTGGLDSQVIMWRRPSAAEPFALHKKLGHHTDFVYAVAPSLVSASSFYSGSKDKTAVRIDQDGNPVMQFVGHEGTVCSLVERGPQLITGAWDGKAKVWDSTTGELQLTLDAGAHAVAVALLPSGDVVTGSQDRSLRVFRGAECIHRVNEAHGDIIRAISACPNHLITASNDNSIKMWSFDGCEMLQLTGHQSFVYGVAHSPDSQSFISSSDDCTLKLWSVTDMQCKQSIVHAGTVWQATFLPNSDVVTCCSDMIVRVWTTDPSRMATEAERQAQQEMAEQAALQAAQKGSSSVPMDTATDISQMPTTFGKKNGEIKCFKDGATVFAFSWNAGGRQWDKIGEVVGSQEEKKFYAGDSVFARGEYDFVFDVEMGPDMGMKKLPYNKGQNAMQVAEAFCNREAIHRGNIEQIRQFIVKNGGGEGGTGGVHGPGTAGSEIPTGMFPVMSVMVFKDGKFEPLQAKILEFNEQVDEQLRLDAIEVMHLQEGISKLKLGVSTELRACEKDIIHLKLGHWPNERLFPVIDLWRLYLVHPASADIFKGSDRGTPFVTQVVRLLGTDPNSALGLCCTRYLANLFIYQTNRYAAFDKREYILKALEPVVSTTNKHTKVACMSVLLNFAIVLHESTAPPKQYDASCAALIARLALDFLQKAGPDDGDAQQRAVLAIGTLLPRDKSHGGGAVAARCKEAGLLSKLVDLESKVGANAVGDLRRLLA